jgi:hypothetical protein
MPEGRKAFLRLFPIGFLLNPVFVTEDRRLIRLKAPQKVRIPRANRILTWVVWTHQSLMVSRPSA